MRSRRKGPPSQRRRGHLHHQPLCRDRRELLRGPPWAPAYKEISSDKLAEFIDRLGSQWGNFMEDKIGPFDGGWKGDTIDCHRAHVVTGINHVERYEGDD